MVIPSLMPFLSLVLPTRVNRRMNIVFGALYSVTMILAIRVVGILYFLRIDRNRPDGAYRLVPIDVAEAAKPLIACSGLASAVAQILVNEQTSKWVLLGTFPIGDLPGL